MFSFRPSALPFFSPVLFPSFDQNVRLHVSGQVHFVFVQSAVSRKYDREDEGILCVFLYIFTRPNVVSPTVSC